MLFSISLENRDEFVDLFLLWEPHIEIQRVILKDDEKKRKELIVAFLSLEKIDFNALDLFDLKSLENIFFIQIPESMHKADPVDIMFYVEDVMNSHVLNGDAGKTIMSKEEVRKLVDNFNTDG